MYVAFLIYLLYCCFLSYCLQLVTYSYLMVDCLLVFSEFFVLFRLVLVFCDIDTGDKNDTISMVSKMLIS